MSQTRVLVAILVVLIPVAVIVYYWQYAQAETHDKYLGGMFQRVEEFNEANDPAGARAAVPAPPELAAPVAAPIAGPTATVKRLELTWTDSQGTNGVLKQIDGCLPIGPGRDVLWRGSDLFLATAPDVVRRVSLSNQIDSTFNTAGQVSSDGQYVWVSFDRAQGPPRLVVVDPQSEKIVAFSNADGSLPGTEKTAQFPSQDYRLVLSPSSPGKVCAVVKPWGLEAAGGSRRATGSPSGSTNFWIATLQFDAAEGPGVAATPAPPGMDLMEWPIEMISFTALGQSRVVVTRGQSYPAIIIDPEDRTVTVAKSATSDDSFAFSSLKPSLSNCLIAAHAGAIWRMRSVHRMDLASLQVPSKESIFGTPVLVSSDFPELKEQAALKETPVGLLASSGGDLYIIGERVWRLRGDSRLEALGGEPLWQFDDYLYSNYIIEQNSAAAAGPMKPLNVSKPPALSGRDSFVAQRVAASEVFGLLVMAIDPSKAAGENGAVYQVSIARQ